MTAPLRNALVVTAIALATTAGTAHAAGVSPKDATTAQRDEAQARFARGRELYAAKKPKEALVEFEASAAVVASPNTQLYVARCLRALGDLPHAHRAFARTERDARALQIDDPRYAQTADAAMAERLEIERDVALVDVSAAGAGPDDRIRVGDDELRPSELAGPIAVAPGTTRIALVSEGRTVAERDVDAPAGGRRQVSLAPDNAGAPPPSTEGPPPLRTAAYVAGGVAVAGLATFTIAGLLANGTYGDLRDACGAGPCAPGREDDIDRGRTQQTVANVGLAVFALSGAAAVTMFVLSRPKATTTTSVLAGPGFVGLGGRFR